MSDADDAHDHEPERAHGHERRPRSGPPARVDRRDDGLGQRALRAGVSPQALIVHLGTDVVVRTPSRPDHHDGNVVDLLAPPGADDVPALVARVQRTMAPLGVAHVHVRFERPIDAGIDPALAAALSAAGLKVELVRILELDAERAGARDVASPQVAGLQVERLAGPPEDGSDRPLERRWHAAAVLDRYAVGQDVATWRAWDEEGAAWAQGTVRALARLGRAETWLAVRQGMPVAKLTVTRDLDGIAVIEDLVTHPAHRGRGIARALVAAVIAEHRARHAPDRLLVAVLPGSQSERLHLALGMRPIVDVCSALRPGAAPEAQVSAPASSRPLGGAGDA